jgi:hypothetical protein
MWTLWLVSLHGCAAGEAPASAPTAGAEATVADPGVLPPTPPPAPVAPAFWVTELAPGFELGHYALPVESALGPGRVNFVRLDPARVELRVAAASLGDGQARAASAWAETLEGEAVAVVNASMFREDILTSVGRLRVEGRVQNDAWAGQQKSLFVADPLVPRAPRAALLNLGCVDRTEASAAWATQVQSIRMVGCDRKNVWAPDTRAWSSALVGADGAGRLLFLHTRAPYPMHDLVAYLLAAPLDLVALHYGEGGPEASLFVRGPGVRLREVGSYETGFVENDGNVDEWPLPNVLIAVAPAGQK